MNIFGWMGDHSGCGWYRIALPLGEMRRRGHDVRWGMRMEPADMDAADIVVGQRVYKPAPSLRWQELAARDRVKLVFELDDDLWSVDSRNATAAVFHDPDVRQNLVDNLRVADLVTVSTEPLAQVVRRWHSNVVVLPNSIPSDMLTWRTGRHEDRVTIGWQGGPTHERDWEKAIEPVNRWWNRTTQPVEMHTIGAVPDHSTRCTPACTRKHFPEVVPHRHTGWNQSIPDYYRCLDWHIALAPLAPTRFNESKSHLRALEAAMLGFPVIASNVSAYGGFVQHGITGFLVDKAADWGEYLQVLASNQPLREEMSRQARSLAADHTMEANGHLWEEAYRALLV